MASVTEHLLANLSWKSWVQAKDLHKRIFFTLFVLIVYRLGSYIPLPGVNPEAMKVLAKEYGGQGVLGMFNMISGRALERMSIFALNLMPYISASIVVQLLTAVVPYFTALKKEGNVGKRKLSQYTRYGTVLVASFQGLALSSALMYKGVVYDPGVVFSLVTVVTIVGSTLFLMWLGEQITSQGVGNGSSMIIYAGILSSLPMAFVQALDFRGAQGSGSGKIVMTLLGVIVLVYFIIFMERAYRKVWVQYPRRQVGRQVYEADKTYIPFKLNVSGVLPTIFASTILQFVQMVINLPWVQKLSFMQALGSGTSQYIFLGLQVFLIVFFAFFYTTIVMNPEETAENLRKNGAFVPGYRPGEQTSRYFYYLLNRLTVFGSAYIAFVVILPVLINILFGVAFEFQGTSFLIAVSVSLELISQIHSYIIAHQYGGLMKKA